MSAPKAPPAGQARVESLCDSISEVGDSITLATSMISDLLRLAVQEAERADGGRAGAAIWAAVRYIGDIEQIAAYLGEMEQAARKGGAT